MDDPSTWPLIIALLLLIVLSAFFSGTETAFTGVNQTRLKKLAQTKKSARFALSFVGKYDKVISCILIGNNIVNIVAATLATLICTNIFGASAGPVISTVALTIILLIFGEISPKLVTKEIPEKYLCLIIYPFAIFYYMFYPLTIAFDGWKFLLRKIFKLDKKKPTLTEDEFKMIVTDIKEEGVLNQNEHDLIQKSIIFDDTLISKIMTPLDEVVTINRRMSDIEIKNMFEANNYSRVPYLSEDGEVLGVIYQKDFYEMLLEQNCEIEDIVKPILFVRPTERIAVVFRRFQTKKQHIAVVRETAGSVCGIVTMEDIIEELVGEIDDEYDAEDEEKEVVVKTAKRTGGKKTAN